MLDASNGYDLARTAQIDIFWKEAASHEEAVPCNDLMKWIAYEGLTCAKVIGSVTIRL